MMETIVLTGSRQITSLLGWQWEGVWDLLNNFDAVKVLHGGARGVDRVVGREIERAGYLVEVHPAQWEVYGKSAGYRRNELMARHADRGLAIWDGTSRGTRHMIETLEAAGKPVLTIMVT